MISTPHPMEAEELMAFLDGELSGEREAFAARHLEGCAECAKLAQDLRGVSRRLAEWEVEPCGLRPIEGAAARPRRWWKPVWVVGLVPATAAVVLVISLRYPTGHVAEELAKGPAPRAALIAPQPAPQGQQVNSNFSYDGGVPQGGPAAADFGVRLKAEFNRPPMIARTAQIALVANDFAHARDRVEAILKSHHGYIGQLTVNAPAGAGRTLDAALKVPAAELDPTLAELKKLGRVESESRAGEEVTRQYVDIEARLNNARNAEQRLTAVLRQQTGKIQDVLAVEKEITRVRGEIETMEAERRNLSGRVEFATISVKITEEYKAQLQGPESVGTRLGNAAVAGYRNVAGSILGLAELSLEYGLTLLLWAALLFFPARLAWKRYRA